MTLTTAPCSNYTCHLYWKRCFVNSRPDHRIYLAVGWVGSFLLPGPVQCPKKTPVIRFLRVSRLYRVTNGVGDTDYVDINQGGVGSATF